MGLENSSRRATKKSILFTERNSFRHLEITNLDKRPLAAEGTGSNGPHCITFNHLALASCSLIWALTSMSLNYAYFRHVSGNKISGQLNNSVNVFLIYPCSKPLDSGGNRFCVRVSRTEAKIRKILTFSSAQGSSLSWPNWQHLEPIVVISLVNFISSADVS